MLEMVILRRMYRTSRLHPFTSSSTGELTDGCGGDAGGDSDVSGSWSFSFDVLSRGSLAATERGSRPADGCCCIDDDGELDVTTQQQLSLHLHLIHNFTVC